MIYSLMAPDTTNFEISRRTTMQMFCFFQLLVEGFNFFTNFYYYIIVTVIPSHIHLFSINLSLCLLEGSLSASNASMISSIISACSLISYTQGWSLAFTIPSTFPFRRLSLAAPKTSLTFSNVFLYFV